MMYDLAESENEYELLKMQLDDYIINLEWSHNNKYLLAACSSGTLYSIDVENNYTSIKTKAHPNGLISMAISPNENIAITTGQDGFVKLWNIETGLLINEYKTNELWVEHAKWSPNGNYFAVSSADSVYVFNKEGNLIQEFDEHESTVSGIQWRKDSNFFATSCYGGVRLFEVEQNEPFEFLPWKNSMLSMSWSPDSKFICCGTQDSRVHFFELPHKPNSDFEMSGYRGKVKILEWTHDSNYFLTNCWDEIVIWKMSGSAPTGQEPITLMGHFGKITAAKFQQKSTFLASGDSLGLLLFYDVAIGSKFIFGLKIKNEISSLAWSKNDFYLAVGSTQGELIIMESPA